MFTGRPSRFSFASVTRMWSNTKLEGRSTRVMLTIEALLRNHNQCRIIYSRENEGERSNGERLRKLVLRLRGTPAGGMHAKSDDVLASEQSPMMRRVSQRWIMA
jgi:hypothetical protein